MARVPGAEAVYAVADQFRERCLVQGRSLLWPDVPAWTVDNIDKLGPAILRNAGRSSFLERWQAQLGGQSSDGHRIAADVTTLFYLFPFQIRGQTKLSSVERVIDIGLGHAGRPPAWSTIEAAFERGVGGTGAHYVQNAPAAVHFFLSFARAVLVDHLDPHDAETVRLVANDTSAAITWSTAARNVLLHLLFPDDFESMAGEGQKRMVVKRFEEYATGITDVDIALRAIRRGLGQEIGRPGFDFYEPDIEILWNPARQPPDSTPAPPDPVVATPTCNPASLTDLAARTHYPEPYLGEIETLLLDKRQVVFEGPPGSGKTYLADLFGRWFTGLPLGGPPDDRLELIQFHQSYGYEDFVQGIRPETDAEGRLRYVVRDGIFRRLCEIAASDPHRRHVLIIDEINRGNISRIFGELLLLLEYRDKRARLPYAAPTAGDDAYLSIPDNLYLIGTMNSTDRSLAQVDYALRRRFYFVRLMPVVDGRADVLDGWLRARNVAAPDRQRVLGVFLALNRRVQEELSPDFQVGHSYFMVPGIETPVVMERVWRHAVRPLLEEYFYAHRDRATILAGFSPDVLAGRPPGTVLPDRSPDPEPDAE